MDEVVAAAIEMAAEFGSAPEEPEEDEEDEE
jgi:hypothetical protein